MSKCIFCRGTGRLDRGEPPAAAVDDLFRHAEALRGRTDLELAASLESLGEQLLPLGAPAILVAEASDRLRRAHGPARGQAEYCLRCGAELPDGYLGVVCSPCLDDGR